MMYQYLVAAEDLRANPGQWRAYESEGNCVILAGPGSGKTKTITIKIAQLLAERVRPPRKLACITYSNSCVGELRSRLRVLGIEHGRGRLLLSTVHSFCLTELVLPYAGLAGIAVPNPIKVASAAEARALFSQAYAIVVGGAAPNWFRTVCERVRRTIPDKQTSAWTRAPARETAVVEKYEELLLTNGLMDFDGLVLTGLNLVRDFKWIRAAIRAKFPIIVIDEYQDLGVPLHEMVLQFIDAGIRVIAVGDPDQSIYGFTGAKPELLRELAALQTVEPISLQLNYRCADQIIAASIALLPDPPEFRSHDGRGGQIQIHRVSGNVRAQADFVVETIIPRMLLEHPTWRLGDIALLYRSMNEGTPIAQAAEARGLPYFRLDNGAPIKRTRLTSWLIMAAQWCSGGWRSADMKLSDLINTWRLLRPSLVRDSDMLAAQRELVSALFSLRDPAVRLELWLSHMWTRVLEETFRAEPALGDERDTFTDLQQASSLQGPLEEFTIEIFGNQGKSPDQVNLMTLHASKGLEFEAVVMIGLEAGAFPSDFDRTDEQIRESARLFYVGLTRARSEIHLTFDSNESPFITAIRPTL